ncbi:hypothetical protein ACQUQP_11850 [Marinobacterium sp. YM272]|uniref:hypothetical protein n=1 Tax=Marinobacterium sp. YM272 TaxID=3421654 RepID=UPI003D7F58E3
MDFEKADKGVVVSWVDRQFAKNDTFPSKCCNSGGEPSICRDHITAYKEWTKLNGKRKQILSWIEQWLSDNEIAELEKTLKKNNQNKNATLAPATSQVQ